MAAARAVDRSYTRWSRAFDPTARDHLLERLPTVGAVDPSLGGAEDAYVVKLNQSGSALVYSTYLGGSSNDEGFGIAVDSASNAYGPA